MQVYYWKLFICAKKESIFYSEFLYSNKNNLRRHMFSLFLIRRNYHFLIDISIKNHDGCMIISLCAPEGSNNFLISRFHLLRSTFQRFNKNRFHRFSKEYIYLYISYCLDRIDRLHGVSTWSNNFGKACKLTKWRAYCAHHRRKRINSQTSTWRILNACILSTNWN